MDKRKEVIDLIARQGLLPLYFHPSQEISLGVLRALYAAGIRSVEYTNRGKEALENFRALKSLCSAELVGLSIGVGTIKDAASAEKFVEAGADFIVSPGFAEDVFDIAYTNKVLWIPGCMTPTEIIKAEQFGIGLVKLFPGNLLGPSYVKAIKDIFPGMLFMPTGGVELEKQNLEDWFQSGVFAVGMGSKMISQDVLENQEYTSLTKDAKRALELISEIKKEMGKGPY